MKITTNSVNEIARGAQERVTEQKASDRFAQIMKIKKEGKLERGVKEDNDVRAFSKRSSAACDPLSAGTAVPNPTAAPPAFSAVGSERISTPSSSGPTKIEKLTTEIVHQIDIFRKDGKPEGLNITFDSKTLEGLQVQIRQQDGQLAIHFVTQSSSISSLVARHTEELRESLASKGVKIRDISIANLQSDRVRPKSGFPSA